MGIISNFPIQGPPNVNGLVDVFKVQVGETIYPGDFVKLVNSSYENEIATLSNYFGDNPSILKIDDNKYFVAYIKESDSYSTSGDLMGDILTITGSSINVISSSRINANQNMNSNKNMILLNGNTVIIPTLNDTRGVLHIIPLNQEKTARLSVTSMTVTNVLTNDYNICKLNDSEFVYIYNGRETGSVITAVYMVRYTFISPIEIPMNGNSLLVNNSYANNLNIFYNESNTIVASFRSNSNNSGFIITATLGQTGFSGYKFFSYTYGPNSGVVLNPKIIKTSNSTFIFTFIESTFTSSVRLLYMELDPASGTGVKTIKQSTVDFSKDIRDYTASAINSNDLLFIIAGENKTAAYTKNMTNDATGDEYLISSTVSYGLSSFSNLNNTLITVFTNGSRYPSLLSLSKNTGTGDIFIGHYDISELRVAPVYTAGSVAVNRLMSVAPVTFSENTENFYLLKVSDTQLCILDAEDDKLYYSIYENMGDTLSLVLDGILINNLNGSYHTFINDNHVYCIGNTDSGVISTGVILDTLNEATTESVESNILLTEGISYSDIKILQISDSIAAVLFSIIDSWTIKFCPISSSIDLNNAIKTIQLPNNISNVRITRLTDSSICVIYLDENYYGCASILNVNGTLRSPFIFNPEPTYFLDSVTISSTQVLITYKDASLDSLCAEVLNINGTEISGDEPYIFDGSDTNFIGLDRIDDERAIVTYTGVYGYARASIIALTGDGLYVESSFIFSDTKVDNVSVLAVNDETVAIAYENEGETRANVRLFGITNNIVSDAVSFMYTVQESDSIDGVAIQAGAGYNDPALSDSIRIYTN